MASIDDHRQEGGGGGGVRSVALLPDACRRESLARLLHHGCVDAHRRLCVLTIGGTENAAPDGEELIADFAGLL